MKTILVVDDMFTMRTLICSVLKEKGYGFVEAEDGVAALEQARIKRPDLVITDFDMPRMDGLELCRAIRADADLTTVPIILLTRKSNDELRQRGTEAGATDFLSKPIDFDQLEQAIARLLGH